jgi:predicted O-methyltransferase YrrM
VSPEGARSRIQASTGKLVGRVVSRAQREVERSTYDRELVDLIVSSLLSGPEVRELHNPVRYVELLRRSFSPLQFSVATLRNDAPHAERSVQFQYFLDELERGVAPLPAPDALRMAAVADEFAASREPMGWVDVGAHFGRASSFARKGRLLRAAVRHVRARKVLELGTAYGMGTLFLASAVGAGGVVTTVELGQPMARLAKESLLRHFPDRVHPLEGRSHELVDQVAAIAGDYDVFFHDAEHSHEAYVNDFAAYESLLAPGAVVIYDDIRWQGAWQVDADPDTYGGWLELTKHPRVLHAAEIDGGFGALLLS